MSFDYEANGALDKQTLGSGVIINNTYDPLTNRLTSLFAARPAYLALLDFDYTYDDGTTVTETIYVAGMEITLVDDTETERTIYYGAGGAFRVIEAGDAAYTQTDLTYRLTDHLGSTSLIDDTGLKVEGSEALYGPFGELRQAPTTTLTDFGYTGQRLDSSTGGLMYYGARYYLPELKRFISADTIVPSLTNSQALNRYSYVMNNPVKYIDPSGHLYNGLNTDPDGIIHSEYAVEGIFSQQRLRMTLLSDLENYGVTVEFENTIGIMQQYSIASQLLEAVGNMGDKASEIYEADMPSMLDHSIQSSATAFTSFFGSTHFYVKNSFNVMGDKHGFNCGYQGSQAESCLVQSYYPPQFFPSNQYLIVLASDQIRQDIIYHETSHNITWREENINILDFSINSFAYTFYDYTQYNYASGDNGSYAYLVNSGEDPITGWVDEVTADVLARWLRSEDTLLPTNILNAYLSYIS